MEVLRQMPYSGHIEDLLSRCEEWVPRSLTGRAVLVGVVAGVVVYFVSKKRYKLPPGPPGWPLLGNILEFKKQTVYMKLLEWGERYGPVISFHAGPVQIVALNSTDAVYEALVKRGADFAGRPQSYSTKLISDGGKSIVFGDYSATWKLHRRLATKALRYFMTGSRLEEGIEQALERGTKVIRQKTGPFNPHDVISSIVFNILNNICFNFTCDAEDVYLKVMIANLNSFNDDFGNGLVEDFFPLLRLFPTKKLRRLIEIVDELFAMINVNINKHRKTFSKDNIRDFTDAILWAQKEAEEEGDRETMSRITDAHITQTVADIFAAGIDTSRYTLLWCLVYLALHQDVQQKLHEEVDSVLGSRTYPQLSDRPELPYTDAVLHEAMRLSTVTPLSLPHTTICDTKIGEYDIPRGTLVLINQYALHHDPKNWTQPEKFMPERFLDQNGKMAAKPDSWLPFSAGRRVCLGESVAKPELQLLLAGIMRQFKVTAPPGITLRPKPREASFLCIPADYEVVMESRL